MMKTILILLAGVLVLCAAACGGAPTATSALPESLPGRGDGCPGTRMLVPQLHIVN